MKIHNFKSEKLRWGWNICFCEQKGDDDYSILGIGTGVEDGDFILMDFESGQKSLMVSELKYEYDPRDMFRCRISNPENSAQQFQKASFLQKVLAYFRRSKPDKTA